jgi:hypothetical protein
MGRNPLIDVHAESKDLWCDSALNKGRQDESGADNRGGCRIHPLEHGAGRRKGEARRTEAHRTDHGADHLKSSLIVTVEISAFETGAKGHPSSGLIAQ